MKLYIYIFDLATGKTTRQVKSCYLSKKGRIMTVQASSMNCHGLRIESLGYLHKDGNYCRMYTLDENLEKNKAHFFKAILKIAFRNLRRKQAHNARLKEETEKELAKKAV